jgi:uncharacterized cupredoxin-like copper-binding protein
MTATTHDEKATLQPEGPQLKRTFAMTLVSGGCLAIVAALALFILSLAQPNAGQPGFPPIFLPIFVGFIGAFVVIGTLSVVWPGARRRAWFWVAATLAALLIVLLNARHVPYGISHPTDAIPFLVTIGVVSGALAIVVGGVTSFLEVRRGRAIWSGSGGPGRAISVVIGALAGAAVTSLLADAVASSGGAGVAEAPTTTGVLTAENVKFVGTGLEVVNGGVLGLFVINKDDFGHTFDVDSLRIHVQVPARSATAVAIKPTGPGILQFYCNVTGHREAGMVGTINVE